VWVNGVLQIDNWVAHNVTYNYSRSINLAAGQKVDIKVDYFENINKSVIQLYWLRPGQTIYVAIPPSQLSSSASVMTESSSTGLQAMSIKPTGFIASLPVDETSKVKVTSKKALTGYLRK